MGRKRKSSAGKTSSTLRNTKKAKINPNNKTQNTAANTELKWKSMTIECIEGLNCEDFEGLVGIEELDDYDAVNNNVNVVRYSNDDDNDDNNCDLDDVGDDEDLVKVVVEKSKKNKTKKKSNKKTNNKSIPVNSFKIEEEKEAETLVQEDDPDQTETPELDMSEWEELSVPEPIIQSLREMKMPTPTPIQKATIREAIVDRLNIYGAAPTGSGKTLAFGIPLLTQILQNQSNDPLSSEQNESEDQTSSSSRANSSLQALILTPTRELAVQIQKHLDSICQNLSSIRTALIVGGLAIQKQERILRRIRPDIIVATPGRLWEIANSGTVPYLDRNSLARIRYLVIDEADRMIERAHFAELRQIIQLISEQSDEISTEDIDAETTTSTGLNLQQVFIFSATLTMQNNKKNNRNRKKKKNYSSNENGEEDGDNEDLIKLLKLNRDESKLKICDLTAGGTRSTSDQLQQSVINCMKYEKDLYLYYFVALNPGRTLVFCNSIDCIRRLINIFRFLKLDPLVVHSSMPQKRRLVNIEKFTSSPNSLLFATDIASRGLDIPGVNHVVHYQVPRSAEIYIHRSGRTARIQNIGLSLMLCAPKEEAFFLKDFSKILSKRDCSEAEWSLTQYPINHQVLNRLKDRIRLAQNCDQLEHQLRKQSSNKSWFKKAAKDCDIILNSDDEDQDGDGGGSTEDEDFDDSTVANMDKVTNQRKLKVFQKQLNALLKQNLSYRRL